MDLKEKMPEIREKAGKVWAAICKGCGVAWAKTKVFAKKVGVWLTKAWAWTVRAAKYLVGHAAVLALKLRKWALKTAARLREWWAHWEGRDKIKALPGKVKQWFADMKKKRAAAAAKKAAQPPVRAEAPASPAPVHKEAPAVAAPAPVKNEAPAPVRSDLPAVQAPAPVRNEAPAADPAPRVQARAEAPAPQQTARKAPPKAKPTTPFGKFWAVVTAIWNGFKNVCIWIFKLRKFIMAAPVIYWAVKLALLNSDRLPETVGMDIQASGEFARMVSRQTAVLGPLAITGFCLFLLFCSRKTLLPWLISLFTLILPVLIWMTNYYA